MNEDKGVLKSFLNKFKKLNTTTKVLLLSISATCIIIIAVGFMYSQNEDYEVLFSNLSSSDASQVTTKLEELKTEYKIVEENDGTITVTVPSSKTAIARMDVSATFQPEQKTVGYEILDSIQFGETQADRAQKRIRALEGEITRTLEKLPAINWARVHINSHESNFLNTNEDPSSASITLQLKNNSTLNKNQVRGIVKMVSNSVEGLKPENVEVIDDNANILSANLFGNNTGQDSNELIKIETDKEKNLQSKIDRLLSRVVGKNNSVTEVDLSLNFDKKEIAEQVLGDKVPVSEKSIEKDTSINSPNNDLPGTDTNSDSGYKANNSKNKSNNTEKYTENQTNYEISKRNEKTVVAPGVVNKMTISVVINKDALTDKDGVVNEALKEELTNNIKNAAGFSENRKDEISVTLAQFNNDEEKEATLLKEKSDTKKLVSQGTTVLITLAVLGAIIFLIKKTLNSIKDYLINKKEKSNEFTNSAIHSQDSGIEGITPIDDTLVIEERLYKTIDSNTPDVVKAIRFVMNDTKSKH